MAQPKWRAQFLAVLAETSDVAAAASVVGITVAEAYALRRTDRRFARRWRHALAEGYEHLELELLQRMRFGEAKSTEHKFDNGAALRLLSQHQDAIEAEAARVLKAGKAGAAHDYDAEAVRDAIVAKLVRLRDEARAAEAAEADTAAGTAADA